MVGPQDLLERSFFTARNRHEWTMTDHTMLTEVIQALMEALAAARAPRPSKVSRKALHRLRSRTRLRRAL